MVSFAQNCSLEYNCALYMFGYISPSKSVCVLAYFSFRAITLLFRKKFQILVLWKVCREVVSGRSWNPHFVSQDLHPPTCSQQTNFNNNICQLYHRHQRQWQRKDKDSDIDKDKVLKFSGAPLYEALITKRYIRLKNNLQVLKVTLLSKMTHTKLWCLVDGCILDSEIRMQ